MIDSKTLSCKRQKALNGKLTAEQKKLMSDNAEVAKLGLKQCERRSRRWKFAIATIQAAFKGIFAGILAEFREMITQHAAKIADLGNQLGTMAAREQVKVDNQKLMNTQNDVPVETAVISSENNNLAMEVWGTSSSLLASLSEKYLLIHQGTRAAASCPNESSREPEQQDSQPSHQFSLPHHQ